MAVRTRPGPARLRRADAAACGPPVPLADGARARRLRQRPAPRSNDWLPRREGARQPGRAAPASTFVVADETAGASSGYYALGSAARSHDRAATERRAPEHARPRARCWSSGAWRSSRRAQGRDASALGAAAATRCKRAAPRGRRNAGVRALLVHALEDRARQFYLCYGFQPSSLHPMTLMLHLPSRA
ncbi:MAG: GNAT family N-acetyltransferase [Candidatus Moduliflexus flocculans]|nr:GNAT family N-acetyltransferase [Candidatus Moduliflexus flocculans]